MIKNKVFVVNAYNLWWQYFEYCAICGMLVTLRVPNIIIYNALILNPERLLEDGRNEMCR